MTRAVRSGLVAALLVALAACSLTGREPSAPTTYDFGPQPAYGKSNPPIPGALLIPPVISPAWLDEADIVYRLLYEDSQRPQAYARSRWAADPASLLTDRLRSRFAAVSGGVVTPGYSAHSDYTLRVEIEDFSQRFDAPGQSRGSLRARVTLLGSQDRKLVAQRVFDLERPAAPNAAGAVKALTEATDAFLEEVVNWTVQTARGPLPGARQTAVGVTP
jgi:cholesterol transport system auxiliary component